MARGWGGPSPEAASWGRACATWRARPAQGPSRRCPLPCATGRGASLHHRSARVFPCREGRNVRVSFESPVVRGRESANAGKKARRTTAGKAPPQLPNEFRAECTRKYTSIESEQQLEPAVVIRRFPLAFTSSCHHRSSTRCLWRTSTRRKREIR